MSTKDSLILLVDQLKAELDLTHKEATQFVADLVQVRFNTVQVWMSKGSSVDIPYSKLGVINARLAIHKLTKQPQASSHT